MASDKEPPPLRVIKLLTSRRRGRVSKFEPKSPFKTFSRSQGHRSTPYVEFISPVLVTVEGELQTAPTFISLGRKERDFKNDDLGSTIVNVLSDAALLPS